MPDDEPDLAEIALRRAAASSTRPTAPRRATPAGPSEGRDPQTVGRALDRLMADRGWQGDVLAASVVAQWSQIVGKDLAEHVEPESFDPTTRALVLRASSTAWATQVRLLEAELRVRLEEMVGPVSVITVRGPTAPSWSRGSRRVPGRGPRDTYG